MNAATAPAGAAAAMLLVGTSTAVSATIADYPVLAGQALRYGFAAAILLAVVRHRRPPRVRLTARDVLLLVALAATGLAGFNLFLVEATRHAGPAMIGTVVGAVPLVLALAGPLMEGRRPAPHTVAAALVVALGAAVAAGLGSGSLTGLLLSLGALACEVAFSLLAVPLLPRLGPLRVAAYPAALSVPLLLIATLALDGPTALQLPTPTEATAFAYLGVIVTAAAFFLWYDALRHLGADRAGLFAGLVPVGALLTTVALDLGTAGPADITGALLVATGVALGLHSKAPAPARQQGTPSGTQQPPRHEAPTPHDHRQRPHHRAHNHPPHHRTGRPPSKPPAPPPHQTPPTPPLHDSHDRLTTTAGIPAPAPAPPGGFQTSDRRR
ncbi:DMT family transporter [Streptomyces tritici]|uniref:DMT family transporter n=1 Tax=Streptomyces tritici TaxID=2054410 RepID=UPI003AF044C2